ncbi:MAG: aminotransferase class I/II-fold pyridoxal phosphate-dependent enzyme [Acidimicrobiia bacterium]|nr:aminotransferase class I/II-fold pyridoxal phosphate-dependent enzyme [Acidimicrobiia bacterium]
MSASRRSGISPFYVMEVMKAAAERDEVEGDVLHLEVGQPSTPAPRLALEAAAEALESDRLGYTAATGIPELRRRISRLYLDRHGLDIDPGRVAVTVGASGGFTLAVLSCFDVGDRVAMTEPGYAAYRNILEALGIEVVPITVDAESGFNLSLDRLAAAMPLAGVVVASPSNPTGTVIADDEMRRLAGFCREARIRVISDEIYHGITFGVSAACALGHDEDAVVIQSFSKYQSMTGWRVGWMVVPEHLAAPVERLAQNLFISPPAISQLAAMEALEAGDELDGHVARYRTNRDILVSGLARMGIDRVAPPDGAFYVWADIGHLGIDSAELCRRWLDETGVAVTPGVDFDRAMGHRFVRFSYSESTSDVEEAVARLTAWIDRAV